MYFILSGPPFVNQTIHPGTAYNLIIKDFYYRYFSAKFETKMLYGWDMHGLPIENQVRKKHNFTLSDINANKLKFKTLLEKYSKECIELMTSDFKLLQLALPHNTTADYYTDSKVYFNYCTEVFNKAIAKKLIYRDKKVLSHCIYCVSTLANVEVDYKNTKLTSWYYKFNESANTYFIIWTTTPWTVMLNEAIAYNSLFAYKSVKVKLKIKDTIEQWIVKSDFDINSIKGQEPNNTFEIISQQNISVDSFKVYNSYDLKTKLPMIDSNLVENLETGFLHVSPNHGETDLKIYNSKTNLSVELKITDEGYYSFDKSLRITDYVKIYEKLGKNVITTSKRKTLYPHCWRCKNQVIKLAKDELFLKVTEIKSDLISQIKKVKWNSESFKNNEVAWLENAYDWCITRTRAFGVPVPNLISNRVFDVWFESGCAFMHAKPNKPNLIVEGVDQIRGWFYTLAVLSYVYYGEIAYSSVHVHGYLLDDKNEKLSKSKLKENYSFKNYMAELNKNKISASCFRYYLLLKPDNQEFVLENIAHSTDIKTAQKILHIWKNCKAYLESTTEVTNIEEMTSISANISQIDIASLKSLSAYILFKLATLMDELDAFVDELKVQEFALKLKNFIVCNVSHEYIRFLKLLPVGHYETSQINKILLTATSYLLNLITGQQIIKKVSFSHTSFANYSDAPFLELLTLITYFRKLREDLKIPLKITIAEVTINKNLSESLLNIFKKELNIIEVKYVEGKNSITEIHTFVTIKMNIIRHIKSTIQKEKKLNPNTKLVYIDLEGFDFTLISNELTPLNVTFVESKLNTVPVLFDSISLKLEVVSE